MKQVQAITARFTLIQGGRTETTEIPATMFLDKQGDRHIVRFTNAIDGPAELADAMVRAYADSNYPDDPDGEYELQEELEGLHRQYETEIRAAMLDPQAADQAAAEWLNEEAERLDRELLTKPKARGLTATSRSGGITISAHSPLP